MAKGKKTGGKNFQKGKSGNPGGRPALPDDLKAARKWCYEDMIRTIIEVGDITPADFKVMSKMDIHYRKRAIIAAYRKCDYRAIKDYEDRVFGKAKENIGLRDETDYSEQLKQLNEITDRVKNAGREKK